MAAARPSSVSVAISYVLPVVGWRHVCPLSARQRRRKNSVYSKVKRQKAALNRKRRVYNCHAKPAVRWMSNFTFIAKKTKAILSRNADPKALKPLSDRLMLVTDVWPQNITENWYTVNKKTPLISYTAILGNFTNLYETPRRDYRMLTPDFQSTKWFSPYRRTQCKMRAIVTDVVAWSVRPLQKRMNRSREVMQLTRTSPKHVLDGVGAPNKNIYFRDAKPDTPNWRIHPSSLRARGNNQQHAAGAMRTVATVTVATCYFNFRTFRFFTAAFSVKTPNVGLPQHIKDIPR